MVSSPTRAPVDQSYDILNSFKEWLKVQETRVGSIAPHLDEHESAGSGLGERYFSPNIGTIESYRDVPKANLKIPPSRPSVRRRLFRTFAYGLVLVVFVGFILAWQSNGDKGRDFVGASVGGLSSLLGAGSNSGSDSRSAAKLPSQGSIAAGSSSDLHLQIETMVNDVAAVRHIVEQLAAKQEQMGEAIARLQAAEQNVGERLSSLPQAPAVEPPRKNVPRIERSEAAQSRSVPIPMARPVLPQRP